MKGVAKLDLGIIGAFTITTIVVTGYFYYTIFIQQKALPTDKENLEKLREIAKPNELMKGIPIKRVLVNLQSNTARLRFLELELSLFPIRETEAEKLKTLIPVLQDSIINISSKMSPDELNSISGKILLEERIKRNFHEKIGEKLISKIFYTKFVVQ